MSSIFNNINDTSNYNSILSQSKALKESKENNQVSFANTLIKENLTKLNELNTKNSQSLIKSEIL
ncbi:MAG: flagellar biosynthesis protein FlgG, partial [Campylobacter sp.]|nr:flagellar biosynthesis protein FlgG [Campylobacter sp.]